MTHSLRKTAGFTLLEIILAVLIFALIILGAQQIFSMAIKSADTLNTQQQRLHQLSLALSYFEKDLTQIASRTIRSPDGITEIQPLQTDINDNYLFRVTRNGWKNPLYRSRPELQAVLYSLDEDTLVRTHSLFLDTINNVDLVERKILDKVENFDIKFLLPNGDWSADWPLSSRQPPINNIPGQNNPLPPSPDLPIAVEIQLELEDYGKIRKIFELSPSA